jgi:uncharacterized protein
MIFGLISDTHNYFDPQVPKLFQGVEHILHAGDIGSRNILARLEEIAPVTAVSGNTDDPGHGYPRTEVLEKAGRKFLLHHIVNPEYPGETLQGLIRAAAPDVVVFGHTHKPYERWIGSTLFLNPGYAGKQRFNLPRTVAILHCAGQDLRVELIRL